jgi:hypothetical protein
VASSRIASVPSVQRGDPLRLMLADVYAIAGRTHEGRRELHAARANPGPYGALMVARIDDRLRRLVPAG